MVNPFERKFLLDLAASGVEIVDLLPAFLASGPRAATASRSTSRRTRTGPTAACELAAERWSPTRQALSVVRGARRAPPQPFSTKDTTFTRHGDLHSRLPEREQTRTRPRRWSAHQVLGPDGTLYDDDPDSPIVLLGDSFTGVYQLMDCEHAGVSAHLARELGYPVDLVMSYGGGPNVRQKLLRRGGERSARKKLVIWMMTARDLYDYWEDWESLGEAMKRARAAAARGDGRLPGSAPERWGLARALMSTAHAAGEPAGTDEAWLFGSSSASARARGASGHTAPTRRCHRPRCSRSWASRAKSRARPTLRAVAQRAARASRQLRRTRHVVSGARRGARLRRSRRALARALLRAAESPGAPRNVELLRRGEAMPDDWYQRRFPLRAAPALLRDAADGEVVAVVGYNVGNERRPARYVEAEAAYARAARRFPSFAEAHASLGAMQHLLGELPSAAASYRVARQLNSALPGLDTNGALLDAELHGAD